MPEPTQGDWLEDRGITKPADFGPISSADKEEVLEARRRAVEAGRGPSAERKLLIGGTDRIDGQGRRADGAT